MMTLAMSAMFEGLRQKFGQQVQSIRAERENEIYLLLSDADIRPITEHLRSEFGARLVMVFAEDRRSVEGVFFNYYVFEQKGSAQYLIVKAPVRTDRPEFPALSAELPIKPSSRASTIAALYSPYSRRAGHSREKTPGTLLPQCPALLPGEEVRADPSAPVGFLGDASS